MISIPAGIFLNNSTTAKHFADIGKNKYIYS